MFTPNPETLRGQGDQLVGEPRDRRASDAGRVDAGALGGTAQAGEEPRELRSVRLADRAGRAGGQVEAERRHAILRRPAACAAFRVFVNGHHRHPCLVETYR